MGPLMSLVAKGDEGPGNIGHLQETWVRYAALYMRASREPWNLHPYLSSTPPIDCTTDPHFFNACQATQPTQIYIIKQTEEIGRIHCGNPFS
jgi:hypothetical protein